MPHLYGSVSRRDLLKGFGSATAAVLLCGDADTAAGVPDRHAGRLQRISPDAAGISPAAILAFVDAVDSRLGGLHSFMLLRNGKVAAEGWWAPYAPSYRHMLYSLSKSFTSTAVGLAVADGLLKVDDPVISFFPDRAPARADANLQAMRVRHLLSMSTGHDKDATGPTTAAPDGDWVRAFLSLPVQHAPGSKFVYNSGATYMCSAIVQKLTGKTVLDYLTPRLFAPLGIAGPTWDNCPKGINVGGWGLNIRTEDIAKFGQLYLQRGKWAGRQLVPSAWIDEATSKQVSNGNGGANDWAQGYGYQFWRCRHAAYRGDGAFGQFCVVMPDQDAVLAITSGVGDMQAVLNAAWDHLLPGMQPAGDQSRTTDLARRLAKLEVPAPAGSAMSPAAETASRKTFTLDTNAQNLKSAIFEFTREKAVLTLQGANGDQKIVSGHSRWIDGVVKGPTAAPRLGAHPSGKIAARGAWTADDTYTVKVCYVEAPYVETITCRFAGNEVTIARKLNVSFGPTERPTLTGRA